MPFGRQGQDAGQATGLVGVTPEDMRKEAVQHSEPAVAS